eukprot:scaffold11292_cov116-Cylindrotheca_fusiformis.AAC.1
MRIYCAALIVLTTQALEKQGLRGVSIEEDASFYDRFMEEVSSMTEPPGSTSPPTSSGGFFETPAPTPCITNIPEDCAPECFEPNPPDGLCPPECSESLDGCDEPSSPSSPSATESPTSSPVAPTPTALPSQEPSSAPVPCEVLIEECPEKCWEVDPFDRFPLCTDFNRPDCDVLPFPFSTCPTCCPTACNDAPDIGDCNPTPLPTMPPTESPSTDPTSSQCIPPPNCPASCGDPNPPAELCSPACIACPPDSCDIDIQINPNCPSLPCEWDVCKEQPSRLEFIYNGGGCSSTEFLRCPGNDPDYCNCTKEVVAEADWPNQVTCEDFNGGPPAITQFGTTSWIRATPADADDIYFEGAVKVGSTFNATATNTTTVAGNIDLFIYEYDSDNDGPGALLQQVLFHSSCSQELFLADTFGANQLVEFESSSALVSLFRSQRFSFTLDLAMESNATELVLSTANVVVLSEDFLEPQLESFNVSGVTIPPSFSTQANFTIVPEENHTAIASVGGVIDGSRCNALTTFSFSCGHEQLNRRH